MGKITNFNELEKALEDADYDFYEVEITLDTDSTFLLQKEIKDSEAHFAKNANGVFEDYYSMTVPSPIIQEILAKDLKLALEVYLNSVRDTCQRELLIDALLSHIGMNAWPTYGEGDAVFQAFIKELKEKTKANGIEFKEG